MSDNLWTPRAGRVAEPLADADLLQFQQICSQKLDAARFAIASEIKENIPIYDADKLLAQFGSQDGKDAVMDELNYALASGPGVLVMRKLIPSAVIDRAEQVTEEVRRGGYGTKAYDPSSKHSKRTFAYNLKHALHDPESYADYYGNEVLAAVCESWLGPSYQITATTNAIRSGGEQQAIHRDYPMSHQPEERIRRFPLVNQITSQLLTLQAAIAHTDMPLATGPTRFMPFSQQFHKGYLAFKRPEYIDFVKPRMVQLELAKGDAVFFNPATFHQPGENVTDQERVANLLQVNSPFSRPMEIVDRHKMTKSVWPVLKNRHAALAGGQANGHTPQAERQLDAVICATCDDFGYPRNIDRMNNVKDETQADLVRKALKEGWTDEQAYAALDAYDEWHRA